MPALREATCSTAFTVLSAVNSFDSICKLLTTLITFTRCQQVLPAVMVNMKKQKLQKTSKSQPNLSLFWFGYNVSELAIEGTGKLGQMGILGKLIVVYDD